MLPRDQRTRDRWFNTNAFTLAKPGQFGNAVRQPIHLPGLNQVDASAVKNFRFHETHTLQFRAEFFNFLNRPNFDLPDIFVGSPTFGRILSAQSPRHIQFGVKLLF